MALLKQFLKAICDHPILKPQQTRVKIL